MEIAQKGRILLGLLLVSLLINIFQARYIHSVLEPSRPFHIGEKAQNPEVIDILGNKTELSFTDTSVPTVLYIFRPDCVWCQRNTQTLDMLASGVGTKYRVIGLSLNNRGLENFLRNRRVELPVYVIAPFARATAYLSVSTPTTILISPTGVIRNEWSGAYVSETRDSLEAFFGIPLHDAAQQRMN